MKKNLLHEVINYFMIFLGTMIYAMGLTLFFLPYGLTSGGVSGVATIIYYLTGVEVEVTYAIINFIFLIFGVKILGWKFSVKTIWGVIGCTFSMWLWQRLAEDPVTHQLPQLVGDQAFMAVIIGAILEGIALAICFINNGSTGGTDIIAACINKYKDVSLGRVIMLIDVCIISSLYFIFHDWHRVIFGFVLLITSSVTLDYIMRREHQAVEFKIFSRNYKPIADAILKEEFGCTILDGEGWYTHTSRKVILCIGSLRYKDIIMRTIKKVDPTAFVSLTYVNEVYGEGFSTMKTKIKGQKPIIVFATNNAHKLEEVRQILSDRFEVRSLKEVGCFDELPETHKTLEENSLEKARYINQFYGFDCFADDTGLEVDALGGAPGVYSARYANIDPDDTVDGKNRWDQQGKDHDSEANMQKLLSKLEKVGAPLVSSDMSLENNRKARFRTIISLIYQGKEYQFEGIVNGTIATEKHGTDGFGYDPIFIPDEQQGNKTFAEMSPEQKNAISHRGRAVEKLAAFFKA